MEKIMKNITILLLLESVLLISCGISIKERNEIDDRKAATNQLIDDDWWLYDGMNYYIGGARIGGPPNAMIYFSKDGEVIANTEYNEFKGKFKVSKDSIITVSDVKSDKVISQLSASESVYSLLLSQQFRYKIKNKTLEFLDSNNVVIARFIDGYSTFSDSNKSVPSSYQGTYVDITNLTDGTIMETRLTLKEDQNYDLIVEYIGSDKPNIERYNGHYLWHEFIEEVSLNLNVNDKYNNYYFKVEKNKLIPIKYNGFPILGSGNDIPKAFSNILTDEKWYLSSINDILVGESNGLETENALKNDSLFQKVDGLGDMVFGDTNRVVNKYHIGAFPSLYQGTYIWEEDCNDCVRIEKRLTLKENKGYDFVIEYIGSDKPNIQRYSGPCIWQYNKDVIGIDIKVDGEYERYGFEVKEGMLIPKEIYGSPIIGSGDDIPRAFSNDLTDEKWYLSLLLSDSVNVVLDGESDSPTIKFENDGHVKVKTECGFYNGEFDIDESGLVNVNNINETKIPCTTSLLGIAYQTMLSSGFSYVIDGDEMAFMDRDGYIFAKFVR